MGEARKIGLADWSIPCSRIRALNLVTHTVRRVFIWGYAVLVAVAFRDLFLEFFVRTVGRSIAFREAWVLLIAPFLLCRIVPVCIVLVLDIGWCVGS